MSVLAARLGSRILERLAEPCEHTVADLASRLGVPAAALEAALARLRAIGVAVESDPGGGCRLLEPVRPLDAARISRYAADAGVDLAASLAIVDETESTNRQLAAARRDLHGSVLVAEFQTEGRGRGGRRWQSAAFRNLMLSLGWRFLSPPHTLGGLSLAAGVAVAELLTRHGVAGVTLKWPNDIFLNGRKLGGVLVDMATGTDTAVVIGVGLNLDNASLSAVAIDQPWTDLRACPALDRDQLVAGLVVALRRMLGEFIQAGFGPFVARWNCLDALSGRAVEMSGVRGVTRGTALGVDISGALQVRRDDGRLLAMVSGEARLRIMG